MIFQCPRRRVHLPPQTFALPALLLSSLSCGLRQYRKDVGVCKKKEQEEGRGGEGRLHSPGRAAPCAEAVLTHTPPKGGDINWGRKEQRRVRFPPGLSWEGQRCS